MLEQPEYVILRRSSGGVTGSPALALSPDAAFSERRQLAPRDRRKPDFQPELLSELLESKPRLKLPTRSRSPVAETRNVHQAITRTIPEFYPQPLLPPRRRLP